jgi:hypothetical protein
VDLRRQPQHGDRGLEAAVIRAARHCGLAQGETAVFPNLPADAIALAGPPAAFGKLIADETEKYAKVVKFAGIKAD